MLANPQTYLTTGLCADLQLGPLVSGAYVVTTSFRAYGGRVQKASIYEELAVT